VATWKNPRLSNCLDSLGKITAIFPGRNGITLIAKIKTPKLKFCAEKDVNDPHFTFFSQLVTETTILPTETEESNS
jgi:hypothetical protein